MYRDFNILVQDQKVRDMFKDWPLLPLRSRTSNGSRKTYELAAVRLFSDVLILPKDEKDNREFDLRNVFQKIGIPVLDMRYFESHMVATDTVGTSDGHGDAKNNGSDEKKRNGKGSKRLNRPKAVDAKKEKNMCKSVIKIDKNLDTNLSVKILSVISRMKRNHPGRIDFSALSVSETNKLLTLFAWGFQQNLYEGTDSRQCLREMPLFEMLSTSNLRQHARQGENNITDAKSGLSSDHGFRKLTQCDNYIIDSKASFPVSFKEYLQKTETFLVFKYPDFYRFLGVQVLSKKQVFEKFLVASCDDGEEKTSIDNVVYDIKMNWNDLRSTELEIQLSELKFVPCSTLAEPGLSGIRMQVQELYDPRQKVFSRLFENCALFPGGRYRSNEWLDFLGKIGLRQKISARVFIHCAVRLQELNHELSGPDLMLSGENRISINELLTIADKLVSVLWNKAAEFTRTMPGFWSKVSMLAFVPGADPKTGSISLWKYSDMVLDKDFNLAWTNKPVLMSHHAPPLNRLKLLAMHSPPQTQVVMKHILNVTGMSLGNLRRMFGERSKNRERVFDFLGSFDAIFSYLQDHWSELSSRDISILRQTSLVPVASRLVKPSRLFLRLEERLFPFMFEIPRAYGGYDTLFRKLGTTESPSLDQYLLVLREISSDLKGSALNVNEISSVMKIILSVSRLLDQNSSRLQSDIYVPDESNRLILASNCLLNDSQLLAGRIDKKELKFVSPKMPLQLCEQLGIRKLSDEIREVLVSIKGDHLKTPEKDACTAKAEKLQKDGSFQDVFSSNNFASGCLQLWEDGLSQLKNSVVDWKRLPTATTLQTTFRGYKLVFCQHVETRLERKGQTELIKGSNRTTSHVIEGSNIFVASSHQFASVESTLGNIAMKLMNSTAPDLPAFTNLSGVCAMFQVRDPATIPRLLESRGIRKIDRAAILRGTPGEVVTKTDLQRLCLDPLRIFFKSETIAWVEEGGNEGGEQQTVYRYGKVLSEQRDKYNALSEIEVNVGKSNKARKFLSSNLYCFRSSLLRQNVNEFETGDTKNKSCALDVHARNIETHATTSATGDRKALRDTEMKTQVDVSDNGNIDDKSVLVGAVSSILARVNLPLSLDQKELMGANMQLQKEVARLKAQITSVCEAKDRANARIQKVEESFVCNICANEDVDQILVPCGHLLCSTCESKLRQKQCPFCRQGFRETVIFFTPLCEDEDV